MKIKVLLPNKEWSKVVYIYLTTIAIPRNEGDPVFYNILIDCNTGNFVVKNIEDCKLYTDTEIHPDILPD